jgi:hypothetical protein
MDITLKISAVPSPDATPDGLQISRGMRRAGRQISSVGRVEIQSLELTADGADRLVWTEVRRWALAEEVHVAQGLPVSGRRTSAMPFTVTP